MDTERLLPLEQAEIEALNALLRGELSAVETYKQALEGTDPEPMVRAALRACLDSHEERVRRLGQVIAMKGGTPSEDAGPWGVFTRVVGGTATMLGTKVTLAALEEGEDHGMREYRSLVGQLDPTTRRTVLDELIPAQRETRDKLSALKRALEAEA